MIILSVLGFILAFGLNIYGYIVFNGDWWGSTLWVNIITTIMLVFLPGIQFLHWNPQNSLLTTSLVCVFICYLSFISQYSYSNSDTGTRMNYGALVIDVVCSTLFFVMTMYGSIMGGTGQVRVTK